MGKTADPKPAPRPAANPPAKQPDGSTPFGQGQPETTVTQDEQARQSEANRQPSTPA